MTLKKRILVILSVFMAFLFIIVIIAYLFATSSGFLTGIILPMLSGKTGIELSAERIDLSLTKSTIAVSNFRFGKPDSPLLTIKEFHGEYFLRSIMNGDIRVENAVFDGVLCNMRRDASGKWQLPFPSNKSSGGGNTDKVNTSSTATKPQKITLNFKNIKLNNIDFNMVMDNTGTLPTTLTLKNFNLNIPEFKTASSSRLTLGGNIALLTGNNIAVSSSTLAGNIGLIMNESFLFDKFNIDINLTQISGHVNNVALDGNKLSLILSGSGDNNCIKVDQLKVQQIKGTETRTNIEASSKIIISPLQIDANYKLMPVSEEIISIACDFIGGYNPGRAILNYSGKLNYSNGIMASNGLLKLERSGNAMIAGQPYALPPMNCSLNYNIGINFPGEKIAFNAFNLLIEEQRGNALQMQLMKQSEYCWSEHESGFNGTTPEINFRTNNFDLRLLQLLLPRGDNFKIISGKLNADLNMSLQAENTLAVDSKITINDFSAQCGELNLKDWGCVTQSQIKLSNFRTLHIENMLLHLFQSDNTVMKLKLNSEYQIKEKTLAVNYLISDFTPQSLRRLPWANQGIARTCAILDTLPLIEARNEGEIKFDLKSLSLNVKKFVLSIIQNQRVPIIVAVKKPYQLEFGGSTSLFNRELSLNLCLDEIELLQLNQLLHESGIVFNSGILNGVFSVNAVDNFHQLKITGKTDVDKLGINVNQKSYMNIRAEQELDIELINFNLLKVNRHDVDMDVNGKKAIKFTNYCIYDFVAKEFDIKSSIHSLNRNVIDLIYQADITDIELDGSAHLAYHSSTNSFDVQALGNIKKLHSPHLNSPMTGLIAVDLSKNADKIILRKLELNADSNGQSIVNITGSGKTSGNDAPAIVNLKSEKMDILLLHEIFKSRNTEVGNNKTVQSTSKNSANEKNLPDAKKTVKFDFGNGAVINFDFNNISYGKTIACSADGRINAIKNVIEFSPVNIIINNAPLNINGRFVSENNDLNYALNGKLTGMNINPLIQPFVSKNMRDIRGIVDLCEFNFTGNGLQSPDLWDNLAGTGKMVMKDISIPNEFEQTTVGRIIVFPVRVLAQLQKLNLAPSSGTKTDNSFAYINDFYKSSKDIRFNTGILDITSKDKRIYVNQCEFKGDFITSLTFNGYAGFGSDQRLKINSVMNIDQLSLPVDIDGTVSNPQTDIKAAIAMFMKNNTLNLLNAANNVGGILEDGGKSIGDVLKKTIEVINPQNNGTSTPVTAPTPTNTSTQKPLITEENAKAIEQGVKKIFNNLF